MRSPSTGWPRGWRDLLRAPVPGLLHGLAVAAFGLLLLLLAHRQFWLLAGAFSGFLMIGPLAATGLYAVSRALEQGRDADAAHGAGRLAAARPPAGAVRAAARRCRHLLGADLGLADHRLRAAAGARPGGLPARGGAERTVVAVRGLAQPGRRAGGAGLRVQRGRHPADAGAAHRRARRGADELARGDAEPRADGAVGRAC